MSPVWATSDVVVVVPEADGDVPSVACIGRGCFGFSTSTPLAMSQVTDMMTALTPQRMPDSMWWIMKFERKAE